MSGYEPGTYVKGDVVKVATSTKRAVALVFDGYRRKVDGPSEDVDYRDLQAQAKELDIPANQSADALREQIDAKLNEPAEADVEVHDPDAPELGGDSPLDPSN